MKINKAEVNVIGYEVACLMKYCLLVELLEEWAS